MICNRCKQERGDDFYARDKTCKECRKAMVRANRARKREHYQEYERQRYRNDPRKKESLERYSSSGKGRDAHNQACKRWRERNQDKRAAQVLVSNAIRSGRLVRQPCERCGRKDTHAHHDDYGKPLEVRWLCPKCHKTEHARS